MTIKLKRKDFVFVVMRHDFTGNDVACAASADADRAEELRGEFEQEFIDRGFSPEEVYFYVTSTCYYP